MRSKVLIHASVVALAASFPALAQDKGGAPTTGAPMSHERPAAGGGKAAAPHVGTQMTPGDVKGSAEMAPGAKPGGKPAMGAADKTMEKSMPGARSAAGAEKGDKHEGAKAESREAKPPANRAEGGKATESKESRAGEHGAKGASVTANQRQHLKTAVPKVHGVKEARDIDIHVNVGAPVPRTIVQYWAPVPQTLIAVVPGWSAYRIVRYHGQLLIIDPDTFEIVYVLA